MKIHPTALVADGAQLGAEVEIGPYSIVGPDVVLGDGCRIQSHVVLEGATRLGARNVVGHGSVIGAPPQDFAFDPATRSEVVIGDGNTFREYVTIHRGTQAGTQTVVGDGNFVMTGTHFGHNVRVGNRTIIANNCLLAGHVEVADGAVLGGGTVFHQYLRIGRLAMVRGGTRFGKDIIPFASADGENLLSGLNVIGLRRAGVPAATRLEIGRLFKLLFRAGLNVTQAVAAAETETWGPEAQEVIAFVRSSKRGVCMANQRKLGCGDDD